MKKLVSMLLTLAMLVPTFGTLPSFAANGENDASAENETKYVAEVYRPDGTPYDKYTSVSRAMLYAVDIGGTVKLLADSTEDTPVSVIGGTHAVLDLNGHMLKRNNENKMSEKNGYVIDVGECGTLTINDSSEGKGGTIKGGGAKYGGGIYVAKDAVVTMNAGTIFRCYGYYGGGVYLCDNAQFTMNGGKINKCYGHYGGGVYVEDKAVFKTNGGEISDCIAEADGGGIYIWNAKAELSHCRVAKNNAKNGGGIYSDYSMSDEYSILKISNSSVVYNTATGNYGGVYAKGYLVLQSYTTISGNVNYGTYGGGVYAKNDSIELSGSVYVFGNRTNVYRESDVSFGKVLNQAFKFGGEKTEYGFIGVRTDYNVPKTWYYDDHRSYGGCTKEEHIDEMRAFGSCLFSNNADTNFKDEVEVTSEDESTTSFNKRHFVKLVSEVKPSDTGKVNVTSVRYKGILLPSSEYDASYSPESRTIRLNVPDYLTETWNMSVLTDAVDFYNGTKVASNGDGASYGLLVYNTNESKPYTVSVEGGKVNGIEPDASGVSSAQKKFFDNLEIEPIVPNDKVFSHWEVEGDYTIDYISGFKQYAKKLKNVLMPNGNVRFKAVLKNKVSTVEIAMYSPKVGARTPFYTHDLTDTWLKATAVYKDPNGTPLHSEEINVAWKKQQEMFDGAAIHYFDYYANYVAEFQVQNDPDGKFLLADRDELKTKLSMDDGPLQDVDGRYAYEYGDGYDPWNPDNNYQPITQRTVYFTRYYRSEKAPIRNSIPSQISVKPGTTKAELINRLPDSVNVQIADISYRNGEELSETTHSPVTWDTSTLPETVTEEAFWIYGTYKTDNEGFEVKKPGEDIVPSLYVDPIAQSKSLMPQVTVDGTPITVIGGKAKLALGKKIGLVTSMEGATIHYKLDNGALTPYTPDAAIEIPGAKDTITTHTIEAYAEANGAQSDPLKLTLEVDNQTSYSVKIVESNGTEYMYATGGGEYKLGDKVSVDLYQKYMERNPWVPSAGPGPVYDPKREATSWSAKGIVLNEDQLTNHIFDFEMPNSNVTITIESFRNKFAVYNVTIIGQDGKVYEHAMGAGQYMKGETVTIDSTKFVLKSVDAEGNETSEEKRVQDRVVSEWSAEGITLSDEQKNADSFTFTMPAEDVTIKAESFGYLVKKLYLTSIVPIAGKKLPDALEIISATDVNGNPIAKKDINVEIEMSAGYKWSNVDTGEELPPESIAQSNVTYATAFAVKRVFPNINAICDKYEVYMNGEKVYPTDTTILPIIYVVTKAKNDELMSVNLADGMSVYSTANVADSLPKKVDVRTKYGTINTADVTWEGTDQLSHAMVGNSYILTAKLVLPDHVDAADSLKTKKFEVKIRQLVGLDGLKLKKGSIPAKAGEILPTKADVVTSKSETTLYDFKIVTANGEEASGQPAVAGETYTVKAWIQGIRNDIAFSKNTVVKLNSTLPMEVISVTESASSRTGDICELSYTFTAEAVQEYDVVVNGTQLENKYKNGDTVKISTTDTEDFDRWTAEAVYDATEDVYDKSGKVVATKTVTHRDNVNLFDGDNANKPSASFVMPLLVDSSAKLEITANYAYGASSYDRDTRIANLVADHDCKGAKVIFAVYDSSNHLLSVRLVDADLKKGKNTVTSPADFAVHDGEKLKIMVWNSMEDMKPQLEAFEQTYEKTSEEAGGTTGDAENTENTENEE